MVSRALLRFARDSAFTHPDAQSMSVSAFSWDAGRADNIVSLPYLPAHALRASSTFPSSPTFSGRTIRTDSSKRGDTVELAAPSFSSCLYHPNSPRSLEIPPNAKLAPTGQGTTHFLFVLALPFSHPPRSCTSLIHAPFHCSNLVFFSDLPCTRNPVAVLYPTAEREETGSSPAASFFLGVQACTRSEGLEKEGAGDGRVLCHCLMITSVLGLFHFELRVAHLTLAFPSLLFSFFFQSSCPGGSQES